MKVTKKHLEVYSLTNANSDMLLDTIRYANLVFCFFIFPNVPINEGGPGYSQYKILFSH
ncbi:MAG TPA: hypothetical protein VEC12_12425 [Bacteroidia bacterium]|nr:hypothetical protein [Bacteroidia bacterium]